MTSHFITVPTGAYMDPHLLTSRWGYKPSQKLVENLIKCSCYKVSKYDTQDINGKADSNPGFLAHELRLCEPAVTYIQIDFPMKVE